MQDTKARKEVEILQQFYSMLSSDSSRAFYGPGHVKAAQELGAINTLLMTDTVFLVNDVNKVSPRIYVSTYIMNIQLKLSL